MRRVVFGTTVLALAMTAVGVHALDNVHLRGSDVLRPVMREIYDNNPAGLITP